jgi:hypothetical protein
MSVRPRLGYGLCLLLLAAAPLAARQEPPAAPAQPDSTRIALAKQLLNLMQPSDSGMAAVLENILPFRELGPMMPPGILDSIQAVTLRVGPMVQDSTAVLYAARFSAPELRDLVDFYASTLGRKLTSESAAMAREVMGLYQRLVMPLMMEQMSRIMGGIRPPDALR